MNRKSVEEIPLSVAGGKICLVPSDYGELYRKARTLELLMRHQLEIQHARNGTAPGIIATSANGFEYQNWDYVDEDHYMSLIEEFQQHCFGVDQSAELEGTDGEEKTD